MFISLGPACSVKYQLKQYQDSPTHFFDWLVSNNTAIIEILRSKSFSSIYDPIKLSNQHVAGGKVMSRIQLNPTLDLISIHDVPDTCTDDEMEIFRAKYNRRYTRLFDTIASESKICFIRKSNVSIKFVNDFFSIIDKISPKNKHVLVTLSSFEKAHEDKRYYRVNHRWIRINLDHFSDEKYNNKWTEPHIRWSIIFELIDTLTTTSETRCCF